MNPVTGPFNKVETFKGAPTWTGFQPTVLYIDRTWYRQRRPYTIPLRFDVDKYIVQERTYVGTYEGCPPYNSAGYYNENSESYPALNKCYGKFVDQVADTSQWANNLIEANKTLAGAVKRITQVTSFARNLRKLNFAAASRDLGVKTPRGVSRRKQFSDNWLEYHFGWEPLVKDIGNGMEALCRDFSPKKVRASGREIVISTSSDINEPNRSDYKKSVDSKVKMVGSVRIVNPNASLLSELGFINPASVAWEAVPFSFVVDWFANVGQVLSSATDFCGKQILDATTTVFQVRDWRRTARGVVPGSSGPPADGPWYSIESTRSIFVRRSLGITGPTLIIKPFKGFSVVRGATAIALLNQFLKR